MLYLAAAISCWGLGAIFDKLVLKYLQPTHAFYLRLFVMIIFFSLILLLRFQLTIQDIKMTPFHAYIYTFLGVFMAMSGVFAYLKAMSVGEASKIVPISSTYPLITLIIAVIFLGESFTLTKFFGTLLIVAGIYFVSK
ncbi:MAG: EamA family transporter [Elusimicrobiales bacterium]